MFIFATFKGMRKLSIRCVVTAGKPRPGHRLPLVGPEPSCRTRQEEHALSIVRDQFRSAIPLRGAIRRVSNGTITTVAGNGTFNINGDSGPANGGQLFQPTGVAIDGAGNVYISDFGSSLVHKVSNGIITTIAVPVRPWGLGRPQH